MNKEALHFILYPVKEMSFNDKKLYEIFDILAKYIDGLTIEDLIEAVNIETELEEIEDLTKKVKAQEKSTCFKATQEVVNILDASKAELEKLAVIGKLLNIRSNETGFTINIYEKEELNEFEFKKTVRNFSLVAGAIGFVPLIPVSDFTLLSILHTGMITKIANIYEHKLEPKEFLKMIGGVLGSGFVFRTLTQMLRRFIPFIGWFINASVAYAGTYAIGILTKAYIAENGDLSKDAILSIWERSLEEGKKEFFSLKDYLFEKKEELLKEFQNFKNSHSENEEPETEKKK